jgi:DNA recombination-dependent growth factor C
MEYLEVLCGKTETGKFTSISNKIERRKRLKKKNKRRIKKEVTLAAIPAAFLLRMRHVSAAIETARLQPEPKNSFPI